MPASDTDTTDSAAAVTAAHDGRQTSNLRGMALMALSTVCVALMYVGIRMVPGNMHSFEVVFFRNMFGLCALLAWHGRALPTLFKTRHLRLHALRGTLNLLAMLLFFTAVLITPLAEVAAMGFSAPLFATALAAVFLRERMQLHRVLAVLAGLAGAVVILRPGIEAINTGALLILVSSFIWAITIMVIKVLAREDSASTIAVYMVTFMAPMSLIPALFVWQWPTLEQLAWLVLVAVLGTIGQVSLGMSFKLADVSAVLPLDFLKLVWGALLGYALFAEVPDLLTWMGGLLIFGSTTYLALREGRSGKGAADKRRAPEPSRAQSVRHAGQYGPTKPAEEGIR